MPGPCFAPPPARHARARAAQCIKDWYKRLPEEIGSELAKRDAAGGLKSTEERHRLEKLSEQRYLEQEGYTPDEIEVRCPSCDCWHALVLQTAACLIAPSSGPPPQYTPFHCTCGHPKPNIS